MCSILCYAGKDVTKETMEGYLLKTKMRGPDAQQVVETEFGYLGFARLAIMGLTPDGMQPFQRDGSWVICNGEIYGFRKIKKELEERGYQFQSGSDCEVLLPLYEEYGLEMFSHLDAEYACVLYDHKSGKLIAARDQIGIRPLFYGYSKSGKIAFASEAKNLIGWVDEVRAFPPGSYYYDGKFVKYEDIAAVHGYVHEDIDVITKNIHDKLTEGVKKRLDADAPLGFLLSGGLDSSLVCAIAADILKKPIRTFAIGMDTDAIDLKYAKEVADFIGAEHKRRRDERDFFIVVFMRGEHDFARRMFQHQRQPQKDGKASAAVLRRRELKMHDIRLFFFQNSAYKAKKRKTADPVHIEKRCCEQDRRS